MLKAIKFSSSSLSFIAKLFVGSVLVSKDNLNCNYQNKTEKSEIFAWQTVNLML